MIEPLPAGALLHDSRNPDLLNVRVISSDDKNILVSLGDGTERKYSRKETLLRRWMLPVRTVVAIVSDEGQLRAGAVARCCSEPSSSENWTYLVETETGPEEVTEQKLRVLKVDVEDPLARLEVNAWRGPKRFFARLGLLERTTIWKQDSEGIPAFLGARIEPLFHQFYAARRCLLDRETRFLLADEVGLGKTIEAGLVVQSLLEANPDLRVLVVAPGTTSRQWLAELYSRFGGRVFTHVDTVRYDTEKQRARDALLESNRLIVTTSLLRTQPNAFARILRRTWDLLVVDEGHHFVNWPDLLAALRQVSAAASSCLVLTATPGRGDDNGLLELLKLVAPATYEDVSLAQFAQRLEPQRLISEKLLYSEELIAALLSHDSIQPDDARELADHWSGLFPDDAIVLESLGRMQGGDGEAAEELIAHIQEHYRVDRRIIRTRRRTLAEYGERYASREFEPLEYEPCPAEVAFVEQVEGLLLRPDVPSAWRGLWGRLSCTTPTVLLHAVNMRLGALRDAETGAHAGDTDPLAVDFGPAEEAAALTAFVECGPTFVGENAWLTEAHAQLQRWLNTEARAPARFMAVYHRLQNAFQAETRKVVIFAQSRPVVEALGAYLRAQFGADAVAVMTYNLEDDELAEIARRFESRPQCLVLVSDEIGAEGRNFQFADAIVHLDQPSTVARVEQRIGRLDRIGRPVDRPVLSVAVTGPSELERAILRLNRDVFRVYERSIGGLEYLLPKFQHVIAQATSHGAQALTEVVDGLRSRVDAEEQRVDEAFSFFLDTTRPELERAKRLAELVGSRSGDEDVASILAWCRELRVRLLPQPGDLVKVEVRAEQLDAPLASLGPGDWIKMGAFERRVALETTAVQYLAPGHIFLDALVRSAHHTNDARATAFFRDLGGKGRGRVFCMVVGRLGPNEDAFSEDRSPGTRRRAEHYLPIEWVRSVFEIQPDGELVPISAGPLFVALTRDLHAGDRKCHPDQMSELVESHAGLWLGLRAAVNIAKDAILVQKSDEIHAAADELEEALRSEMAYLRTRKATDARDDSDRALRERETLLASVCHPAVVIDSVAIVIGADLR